MISDSVIEVARMLHDRIEGEYDAIPTVIKRGNSIGFNIGGREAGRVGQDPVGDVNSIFYSSESQAFLPVFS